MSKVGLIDVGGGMRGIYGAGVLDCFLDDNIEFDYCIGVSAGSANVASFLARQKRRNYRFYTQHALDKRYMSLNNIVKKGSYFDLIFIYDTLTNRIDPIDYDTLLNTRTEVRVVSTEAESGRPVYFDNSCFKMNDCRILMASSSLPLACRSVVIDGKRYFDGGIADPIPINKAFADGCEKIVVILTRPLNYHKKPERLKKIYPKVLRSYPNVIAAINRRHEVYMNSINQLKELEQQGNAIIISPTKDLKVTTVTKNVTRLNNLYKLGLQNGEEKLKILREWVK